MARSGQPSGAPVAPLSFTVIAFVLAFAGQIALYHQSFLVLPSSDDFSPPLAEIERGEREGPVAFFLETKQDKNYRPLQSLTMWLFGRISEEHRFVWIRVMHFPAMAVYGLACLLWVRQMGLGRAGVVVAAIAVFAHPALGGPLGGIDTFAGILTHGIMWLGALAVLVWRERFLLSLSALAVCFVVGSLFKEYAFGLVPLAVLTGLCFGAQRTLVRAVVIGALLTALMLAFLLGRRYVGVTETPGPPSFDRLIGVVVRNAALLGAGTLFTGNTAWVALQRSPQAFAWVVLNVSSLVALLVAGLAMVLRQRTATETEDPEAARPGGFTTRRWIVFLLLSFPAASFPANMLPYEISEIYLTGLMLPLALACGLAADGFARGPQWARYLAGSVAAAHLLVAGQAVLAKVDGLRECGELAARAVDQIVALVPDEARDQTIALAFIRAQMAAEPTYSLFVQPVDIALGVRQSALTNERILPPTPWVMEYCLPERGLRAQAVYLDRFDEIDALEHGVILGWDQTDGRFARLR